MLWIGVTPGLSFLHNNALYSLNESEWQVFSNEELLGSSMVLTIVSDSYGELWIGTDDGLLHRNVSDWISYPKSLLSDQVIGGGIATMGISSDNTIWLIPKLSKRLVEFDGADFYVHTIPKIMYWEGVFEVDINGVWLGGGENEKIEFTSALAYFDGITWTYFSNLPFKMVFNIFRVSDESLMIQTVFGIYLYTPQQ